MVKSLFSFLKKPKSGSELLTELDVSRVVGEGKPAPVRPVAVESNGPSVDIDVWKQNDLDRLQSTWEKACEAPEDEDAATDFRTALHNLHGASGAYGGGALSRLTESLQTLVTQIENLQTDAALINLHVQACRATLQGESDAMEDMTSAVCDALESQVEDRLRRLAS